jgi:hypothetical protein
MTGYCSSSHALTASGFNARGRVNRAITVTGFAQRNVPPPHPFDGFTSCCHWMPIE